MSDIELREKLVAAYRGRRRAPFDEAAFALQGKVLDVLLASIAPARRAAIDAAMTPLAKREFYRAWLDSEHGGPDAGLVLVAACREYLGRLHSRALNDEQTIGSNPISEYASAFSGRAETPWILLEILRGAPVTKVLGRSISLLLRTDIGERAVPAYRYSIIAQDPYSHEFARELKYKNAIDLELAFLTIDNPEMRQHSEPVLLAHAAENVDRLRAVVDRAEDPKLREFALRILRSADKDLTPEGTTASTPLEKVEADLRRDPNDAEASQVWADALSEAGDPRGVYVSFEHAIRAASGDPARAFELSTEQATLLRDRRDEILGRPGGFPFREPFAGRAAILVRSEEPFHVPSLKPALAFDRAQSFVRAHGDVTGPAQVFFADYRRQAFREARDPEVEPSNEEERAFLELLAPARLYRGLREGQTYVDREDATAPLVNEAALAALVARTKILTLVYLFAHVHDGVPLPYQEDVRLPSRMDSQRGRICSRLQLVPHVKKESFVDLVFPFESFEDPAFLARYEAVADALGSLPPSALAFFYLAPNPSALLRADAQPIKIPKGFGKKKVIK